MPIFEYKCRKCSETFEHFTHRASAAQRPICPSCGSTEVERIFSVFAGRVEGGGAGCGPVATGGG
jgi:putative FmdB family regulatory protein